MPASWILFPLLLVPFFASTVLTVGIEGICRRFHIFDLPGERKMQIQPVPRLGGAAFFITSIGFAIGLSLTTSWTHLLGATIVFIGGFIDDVHPQNSVLGKIFFQIPGAALFAWGCQVDFLTNSNWQTALLKIVIFGFVFFMTNAANLMDNMNGLAAGLSIVITTLIATIAFLRTHDQSFTLMGVLVVSSVLGFLVRNFPSGKIYMGDQGSQFLGYFNSSYAVLLFIKYSRINSSLKVWSFVLPGIVLFGLFLFDVIQVVAIRISERRSPFVGDQCHISHQLVKRGLSPVAATSYLIASQILLSFICLSLFP